MDYPEHQKFAHEGLTTALLRLLDVSMLGSEPNFWYTGAITALKGLSAEQASRTILSGYSTVAAHVEHLRISLNYVRHTLTGETVRVNWPETWSLQTVDAAQWDRLCEQLRAEYEATAELIQQREFWLEDSLTEMLYNLSHTAYHAGAIRQIAKAV